MTFERKHLKNIKNYQPGKPIEEVKRDLGLRQVIKLASNESPFPPSKATRKALIENICRVNRYPDSQGYYLKRKLAANLKVKPGNIILGNGSDELIVLALRAFVDPGQEVIVGNPTFLIYEIQAKACGLRVVRSRLKDFRYDLDDIKRKITKKTKLIFIANPDNPNGTYLKHEEIQSFLKAIPRKVIVFFDEAYCEFSPEDFPKSINFLKQGYNMIFTRTFSKVFGLAGLRIGYGIAKPELIRSLDKVREPFNVNSLAQAAACSCLNQKNQARQTVRYINKEKYFFYEGLGNLNLRFVKSATNFILVDLGRISSKAVFSRLLKKGIIVREMSSWGFKNFIRVTVGTHSQNRRFLKALSLSLNH
ncbi:MAG: histidinol-phosphate transaminase [Candidatus Omnitrophica bacterium]|nr:histidinol-phosphate transaminase [Candidatus Omnitrophota bacterium]